MPSEIAQGIVDHIFGDEKAKAVDAFNDAMAATAYDAIQAQKKEFAQKMGFELDQTAQSAADELEDKLVDDGSGETKVAPVLPASLPHVDATPASVEEPIEEPKNETDS